MLSYGYFVTILNLLQNSPCGVKILPIPKTTEQAIQYHPSMSLQKRLLMTALSSCQYIFSFVLSVFRPVFSFIPKTYGECSNRRMVLCKVKCVGINPVDAKSLYGDKMPHWALPLVKHVVDGNICGLDFSGEVITDCPESQFRMGDEVFGTMPPFVGSCAEYVLAPTDSIAIKPKNLSFAEASVIPLVGLTTLQAFDDCNISPGMHVLVLGASGGTGHFAVQMARIKKAGCVTAVCGSRNKNFVLGLGATEVICYDDCPGGVITALHEVVNRHGEVDCVFDAVSSHDPRDQKVSYESQICNCHGGNRILKKRGKYILLGGLWVDWLKAHIKRYDHLHCHTTYRR